MTDQWFPHVTVASIACKDGKYLLVKETYKGRTVINQPAGHLEKNETLEQAVIRETLEETGWVFEPKFMSGIYQFVAPNGETYMRFTFHGDLIEQTNEPIDPAIDEVLWLSRPEIDDSGYNLRSHIVTRCIDDYESGNRLPEDCVICL